MFKIVYEQPTDQPFIEFDRTAYSLPTAADLVEVFGVVGPLPAGIANAIEHGSDMSWLVMADTVICDEVGRGTNRIRVYWVEGKEYPVVRRTKSSFWVIDEFGFERRFSSKTGGSTVERAGYKTYML